MATSIRKLREKLCRELAQSEHDAVVHCSREARRYGTRPPGEALHAIADHATQMQPRLETVWGTQSVGVRAGRVVGETFSAVRHFAVDWVIDAERSYRATLLGLRHGLDVARLLREVMVQLQDRAALAICNDLIEERARLLSRAEERLRWFAEHPEIALRSSRARIARQTEPVKATRRRDSKPVRVNAGSRPAAGAVPRSPKVAAAHGGNGVAHGSNGVSH